MPLSPTTIDEIIDLVSKNIETRANVVRFIQRFGLGQGSTSISIKENLVSILPNLKVKTEGIDEILEYVIKLYYERHPNAGELDILGNKTVDIYEDFPLLIRYLRNDGYVIRNRKLGRSIPKAIETAELQDELDTYLSKYELNEATGHLNQACDNIKRGNWAAANGQIRSFYESVLIKIVKIIDPTSTVTSGGNALNFLSEHEFFKKDLNEVDETNSPYGFIKGFWKILQTAGPHPGLSDEGDCTFRYHLSLITANYYLKRLEKHISE